MSGLDRMRTRLGFIGATQDDRNVNSKLRSMHAALENSYQAEWIHLDKDNTKCRCLINPDKLKDDYDKKEISIDFEYGLTEGDTFYWDRTDTHWLVYLQQYSEEAYFRAEIQRCDYQFDIDGTDYWVYVRGPVETAIDWRQKHNLTYNDLNYTLVMYITKNEETLEYFNRLNIVKFNEHRWQVAATDKYSQPGIIQVYLNEYYDNEMEDNMRQPEIIEQEHLYDPFINGPQVVYPYDTALKYEIDNLTDGTWEVNSRRAEITSQNVDSCEIDIKTSKAGKFILSYVTADDRYDLEITISSL